MTSKLTDQLGNEYFDDSFEVSFVGGDADVPDVYLRNDATAVSFFVKYYGPNALGTSDFTNIRLVDSAGKVVGSVNNASYSYYNNYDSRYYTDSDLNEGIHSLGIVETGARCSITLYKRLANGDYGVKAKIRGREFYIPECVHITDAPAVTGISSNFYSPFNYSNNGDYIYLLLSGTISAGMDVTITLKNGNDTVAVTEEEIPHSNGVLLKLRKTDESAFAPGPNDGAEYIRSFSYTLSDNVIDGTILHGIVGVNFQQSKAISDPFSAIPKKVVWKCVSRITDLTVTS